MKSFSQWSEEAVAANCAGGGAVAAIGIGKDGEPGVSKKDQKKHQKRNRGPIMRPLVRRSSP